MKKQDIVQSIKIITLALIIGTLVQVAVAANPWIGAPGVAPVNNVDAPINTGTYPQEKAGGPLTLNLDRLTYGLNVFGKATFYDALQIGNTMDPTSGAFTLITPERGAGKVLTSDANGKGTWKSLSDLVGETGGAEFSWVPVYVDNNTRSLQELVRPTGVCRYLVGTATFYGSVFKNDYGWGCMSARRTHNTSGGYYPYNTNVIFRAANGGYSNAIDTPAANTVYDDLNNSTPTAVGALVFEYLQYSQASEGSQGAGTPVSKWYIVGSNDALTEVTSVNPASYNTTANKDHPTCPTGTYQSGIDIANPTSAGNIGIAIRCTTF